MNIITWIYVFALYILCSRGVYFKTHKYIHAFVFSVILYLTFDFVDYNKESFEEDKIEINNQGVEDLVNNLQKEINDNILNVDINKEIYYSPQQDTTGIVEICKEKIRDIQKYKDNIENMTKEVEKDIALKAVVDQMKTLITKLNEKEMDLIQEINELNNEIIGKNSIITRKDNLIYNLNNTINDLSGNVFTLQSNLKQKEEKIENDKETIELQKGKISNLNLNISNLKDEITNKTNNLNDVLTPTFNNKTDELDDYISAIGKQDDEITNINTTIENQEKTLVPLISEANDLSGNIVNAQPTYSSLNAQWKSLEPTFINAQNTNNTLKTSVSNAKGNISNATSKISSLNNLNNQITNKLNNQTCG